MNMCSTYYDKHFNSPDKRSFNKGHCIRVKDNFSLLIKQLCIRLHHKTSAEDPFWSPSISNCVHIVYKSYQCFCGSSPQMPKPPKTIIFATVGATPTFFSTIRFLILPCLELTITLVLLRSHETLQVLYLCGKIFF